MIPKFKQQMLFLEERERLFKSINDCSSESGGSSSITSTNSQTPAIITTNSSSSAIVTTNSLLSSVALDPTTDFLPKESIDIATTDESRVSTDINIPFPDDYIIPTLPNGLIKDIEEGTLAKFGPHCSNRQILIDVIAHDLIDKYNLLLVPI